MPGVARASQISNQLKTGLLLVQGESSNQLLCLSCYLVPAVLDVHDTRTKSQHQKYEVDVWCQLLAMCHGPNIDGFAVVCN